ncbi:MAG: DsbA family protein [Candidatus Yanofskybacteria bacterium]|nr:DsbA family protein [Candidatus Yanofskybacteria bacterium]
MENTPSTSAASVGWDKSKLVLSGSILLAALLISGTFFFVNKGNQLGLIGAQQTPDPNQRYDVSIDDDPVLGDLNAPVTIVEFSDFQCPFCRQFWRDTFSQLKKDYVDTGKVRFVYRDFPLSMHPAAQPSALAAQCAAKQGKFWEFQDKMFSEQDKQGAGTITYGVTELKKWAREIGLSIDQCIDTAQFKDEVAKDLADGTKVTVSGTPTFYINGKQIVGAQPYQVFKQLIDEELAAK